MSSLTVRKHGTTPTRTSAATTPGRQFPVDDGSVRFLAETIDFTMYQYFGDKADGNVLKLD